MAFSLTGHRGAANTKTTGTTLAMTVSGANIAAGALVIVRAVTDNQGLVNGATTAHSITDSQSNTYTRIAEYTRTSGGAADGVTASIHYSVLTTGLTSGTDTITLTSQNVPSRALGADEFSAGTLGTPAGSGATGNGTTPAASLSGMTSRTWLYIGLAGREYTTADGFTQDTDYSDLTQIGTSGGGPVSNVSGPAGYRIYASSTGDTYDPSYTTAADWACVIAALYESSGAYTLTAAQGSVALSGQAAGLPAARKLSAEYGSFGETGEAASPLAGRLLTADYGALAETGQAAGLLADRLLTAEYGAYTLTGQAVGLIYSGTAKVLTAEYGAFTLTGQAAGLLVARKFSAEYGAFALTGQTAGLIYSGSAKVLTAEYGAFALTGQTAGLVVARKLSAAYETYTLSGQAAGLLFGRKLSAAYETYALTGQATGLLVGRKLVAVYGPFVLSGQATGLVAARLLTASYGSYTLTGIAATLLYSGELPEWLWMFMALVGRVPGAAMAGRAPGEAFTGRAPGEAFTVVE